MKEFINRLNKKRLRSLGFVLIVWVFSVLCVVSLIFTVSDNVHLEIGITLLFAFVFAFLAFASNRFLYSSTKKAYEEDFRKNALKSLFESSCDGVVYKEGPADVSAFVAQSVISGIDKEHTEYSFSGKYEGIAFNSVFSRNDDGYTGWLFEFVFSKNFKRNIQVRRKGSSLVIPPEKVWEDGFETYETKSEPFNFKYVVNSPSGVDASGVMCEEVVYSLISATEKTRARLSASFDGNRLYVFLQGVMPSYNIPLVSPVSETKLKKELFGDINSALTLSLELDSEKKIWKRI